MQQFLSSQPLMLIQSLAILGPRCRRCYHQFKFIEFNTINSKSPQCRIKLNEYYFYCSPCRFSCLHCTNVQGEGMLCDTTSNVIELSSTKCEEWKEAAPSAWLSFAPTHIPGHSTQEKQTLYLEEDLLQSKDNKKRKKKI